jgi:hypothetical protein
MVRPDLRRDMAGVPEISDPQERERDVEYPEGTSSPQGSTVPSGNLELGFQGNEREITALRARRTHQERTLKED